MRAFVNEGRFSHLMERVRVHVIPNDRTALLGAARCAVQDSFGPAGDTTHRPLVRL
jgi:glucokinase